PGARLGSSPSTQPDLPRGSVGAPAPIRGGETAAAPPVPATGNGTQVTRWPSRRQAPQGSGSVGRRGPSRSTTVSRPRPVTVAAPARGSGPIWPGSRRPSKTLRQNRLASKDSPGQALRLARLLTGWGVSRGNHSARPENYPGSIRRTHPAEFERYSRNDDPRTKSRSKRPSGSDMSEDVSRRTFDERWFSTALRSIGDAVIATDDRGHVVF